MSHRLTTEASPVLLGPLEAWLRAGAGSGTPCERVIETSISWVFLYPDRVLKLKKPVDYGFLDFTTLERRRWAADRELAFNRPAAPDIYRAVRAITREPDGGFDLDGEGPVAEWALEMRRFDEQAVLAEQPEALHGDLAEALGREIARVQADAPEACAGAGAEGMARTLASNAEALSELFGDEARPLIGASERALEGLGPLLDRRKQRGLARRCHGDLHLGNILVEDGRPILFDCIEFNDQMSEIDVLYDVAFLLMDLDFCGCRPAANRVLNGWLDEIARRLPGDHWTGLAALPLFQSARAAVRAHVQARGGDPEAGRRYLKTAMDRLDPGAPRLLAVGGVSGTGKSTLARLLAPWAGTCPGAVILRTDEIRKRQWGRRPTDRLPPEAYAAEASKAVYREMFERARQCAGAGRSVVLDAVFLDPAHRDELRTLSRETGAPFTGLWLEASPEVLRERVAGRKGDASDADLRVLEQQLRADAGELTWRRCDATALAEVADTVLAELSAGRTPAGQSGGSDERAREAGWRAP